MSHRGFSLLEVLVAMTVLLIGLMAVAQLILLGVVHAKLAASHTTAEITAVSKFSELRSGGVAHLEEWVNKNTNYVATTAESNSCLCSGWTVSASDVSVAGKEKLYRVIFVITSLNGHKETFATYLADIGTPVTADDKNGEQPIKIYERQ